MSSLWKKFRKFKLTVQNWILKRREHVVCVIENDRCDFFFLQQPYNNDILHNVVVVVWPS